MPGPSFNLVVSKRAAGFWLVLGPLLAVVFVYHGVPSHRFVNFDDPMFLYENSRVVRGLTFDGIFWAWTNKDAVLWHPLAWMAHMAVAGVAGMQPGPHLLVNLGLHAVNACLLGRLLYGLTGMAGRSLAVALLFAVHPVNVEVAAWASQLKTTLSAFFCLLGLSAYVRGVGSGRESGVGVLGWFAASLLAKPALVFFPAILALLDFWPLRRLPASGDWTAWRCWVVRKRPFLVLAAVLLAMTLLPWTTPAAADVAPMQLPDWSRLASVPGNYTGFLSLFVWPVDLAVLYPETQELRLWPALGAAGLLLAVTALAWLNRARRPELLVGWAWFVLLLIPASGLLRAGQHALADRYLYLPSIGLLIAAVWTGADWLESRAPRFTWVVLAVFAVPLAMLAERQTVHWTDSVSLWRHAAEVTPPSAVRHINLGNALLAAGGEREAEVELRAAIKLQPANARPYVNLAVIEQRRGNLGEAAGLLRQALALAPTDARILSNLGSLLDDLGHSREAQRLLEQAIRFNPALPEAWVNLGVLRAKSGETESARGCFETALRIHPGHSEAARNLGVLLHQMKLAVPGADLATP